MRKIVLFSVILLTVCLSSNLVYANGPPQATKGEHVEHLIKVLTSLAKDIEYIKKTLDEDIKPNSNLVPLIKKDLDNLSNEVSTLNIKITKISQEVAKLRDERKTTNSLVSRILASIGLFLDIVGAAFVAKEFIRRPRIERKIDKTLNELSPYLTSLTREGLFEMLNQLREQLRELKDNKLKEREQKVEEVIMQKVILEKQWYGRLGLSLLVIGFLLQIIAVLV